MSSLVTIMPGPGDTVFRFTDGTIIKGFPKSYAQAVRLFEAGLSTPNNVAAAIGEAGVRRLAPEGAVDPISEIKARVFNNQIKSQSNISKQSKEK